MRLILCVNLARPWSLDYSSNILDVSVRVCLVELSSVAQSCPTLQPHELQHARPPSITNSWSLLKLMSIELVMLSNHLILNPALNPHPQSSSCPQSFPVSGSFQMSQLCASGGIKELVGSITSSMYSDRSLYKLFIKCYENLNYPFSSVQSLGRVQLCDPLDCSTPGHPVHHQPLEFTQIHVHRAGDAIQPSHPLSSPSPPALNLLQHQGLFK